MARLEEFCLFPMKLCGIKRQGNDGDEDDDDDDDDDDGGGGDGKSSSSGGNRRCGWQEG